MVPKLFRLIFIVAVGVFAQSSLAIDCYKGSEVVRQDCERAASQIIYNSDGSLDKVERTVGKIFRNCSIIVLNPNHALVTKKQIENGLKEILDFCNPYAGGADLSDNKEIFLNIGGRGEGPYAPYESDFPERQPTCGLNQGAPPTVQDDCKTAYQSIHVDEKGGFLDDHNQKTKSTTKTYKSCTVIMYTSDGSPLVATRSLLDGVFADMLRRCNGKSGVVSIKQGASGKNGITFLKIRSSVPCGSSSAVGKQVCY